MKTKLTALAAILLILTGCSDSFKLGIPENNTISVTEHYNDTSSTEITLSDKDAQELTEIINAQKPQKGSIIPVVCNMYISDGKKAVHVLADPNYENNKQVGYNGVIQGEGGAAFVNDDDTERIIEIVKNSSGVDLMRYGDPRVTIDDIDEDLLWYTDKSGNISLLRITEDAEKRICDIFSSKEFNSHTGEDAAFRPVYFSAENIGSNLQDNHEFIDLDNRLIGWYDATAELTEDEAEEIKGILSTLESVHDPEKRFFLTNINDGYAEYNVARHNQTQLVLKLGSSDITEILSKINNTPKKLEQTDRWEHINKDKWLIHFRNVDRFVDIDKDGTLHIYNGYIGASAKLSEADMSRLTEIMEKNAKEQYEK